MSRWKNHDKDITDKNTEKSSSRTNLNPRDLGSRVRRGTAAVDDERGELEDVEDMHIDAETELAASLTERSIAQLTSIVQKYFDSVSSQTLQVAVKLVVDEVKNPSKSEAVKKQNIEDILEPMSRDQYNDIVNLTREIPDDAFDHNGDIESTEVLEQDEEIDSDQQGVNPHSEVSTEKKLRNSKLAKAVEDSVVVRARAEALDPRSVDAHWLKELISDTSLSLDEVMEAISPENSDSGCRKCLQRMLHTDQLALFDILFQNRHIIYWYTKYYTTNSGLERETVLRALVQAGVPAPLTGAHKKDADIVIDEPKRIPLDLDMMAPRLMALEAASQAMSLPDGSERVVHGSYEEYRIPPIHHDTGHRPRIEISAFPEWTHKAFGEIESLNHAQTKAKEVAYDTDENLLVCAPTGAGKTTIALMAILRALRSGENEAPTRSVLKNVKIIYVSPLKALIQQQVRDFSQRLGHLGVRVAELSGDNNLDLKEIESTQLIITTPEKWDIVTRKPGNLILTSLVKLVILDEVHLLNDVRGPALENIVARSRSGLSLILPPRIVGLSATMSNYEDVAKFLGAEQGVIYLDASYRPIPLKQVFYGITERNLLKQVKASNDACEMKLREVLENKKQAIVFVNSRRDAVRLSKSLAQIFGLSRPSEAQQVTYHNSSLNEVSQFQLGFHHAGLSAHDRAHVEKDFLDGNTKILISTATLAWGVNLPAHTVIVKNTKVYSPQRGDWEEMPAQDILQMLGRAGRPGFDDSGEGVVITTHDKLGHYLSIMNAKMVLESNLTVQLTASLNAECSLGNVKTFDDALSWLKHTFLYVRMSRDPDKYRVGLDYDDDERLNLHSRDLVNSVLAALDLCENVRYRFDGEQNAVSATALGKIASNYYISPESAQIYSQQLKPWLGLTDIFRVFSLSAEFRYLPVRVEEREELEKFSEEAPIPIREKPTTGTAKANLLLQSYISRVSLDGIAIAADMVTISQSAARLVRAMFEISCVNEWASLSLQLLELCKMISRRMWTINTPFRQFPGINHEIIRKAESTILPFGRYFDLETPEEVGRALRTESISTEAFKYLCAFPRLEIAAEIQPLTSSIIRATVQLRPLFDWDTRIHGERETFHLFVYDSDCASLLKHDIISIPRPRFGGTADPVTRSYTIGLLTTLPPVYFFSTVSDRWIQSRSDFAYPIHSVSIPHKIEAIPSYSLVEGEIPLDSLMLDGRRDVGLNQMQALVWPELENMQDALISAPHGAGKTSLVELLVQEYEPVWKAGSMIYLTSDADTGSNFRERLARASVNALVLNTNLRMARREIAKAGVYISTYSQWLKIILHPDAQNGLKRIRCIVFEDLHDMSGPEGDIIESAILRTRSYLRDVKHMQLGLSIAVADQKGLGSWLGIDKSYCFNFANFHWPFTREIRIRPVEVPGRQSRLIANIASFVRNQLASESALENSYNVIIENTEDVLLFDRVLTSVVTNSKIVRQNLQILADNAKNLSFADPLTEHLRKSGLLVLSERLTDDEIQELSNSKPRLLMVTRRLAKIAPPADIAIVMDTKLQESVDTWTDYSATDMLSLTTLCTQNLMINTVPSQIEFYQKFLNDPIPLESALNWALSDLIKCMVADGSIGNYDQLIDWLASTYFYRRLLKNPQFYGLKSAHNAGDLSEYLSELAEESVESLTELDLIHTDDDGNLIASSDLRALSSSGMKAQTMQKVLELNSTSSVMAILSVLSSSSEAAEIILRHGDAKLVSALQTDVSGGSSSGVTKSQKCHQVLQSYLSRAKLPVTLQKDLQKYVLISINLLETITSWLGFKGYLSVLSCIDLSQMLTQGVWSSSSTLLQIPHVDEAAVSRAKMHNVTGVTDFINIEDDEIRCEILGFNDEDERMLEVANFVNEFPNIDLDAAVPSNVSPSAGVVFSVTVTVERDVDEDCDITVLTPQKFIQKCEQWYLIVGDVSSNQVFGFLPVTLNGPRQRFNVKTTVPQSGIYDLTVWCACDSYLEADRQVRLNVVVK